MFPCNVRFDNYANSPYHRVVVVGDPTPNEEEGRELLTSAFKNMVMGGTVRQTEPLQPLEILYISRATG